MIKKSPIERFAQAGHSIDLGSYQGSLAGFTKHASKAKGAFANKREKQAREQLNRYTGRNITCDAEYLSRLDPPKLQSEGGMTWEQLKKRIEEIRKERGIKEEDDTNGDE
jgi:hypothetical protein